MTQGLAALMDVGMAWPQATEIAGAADNLTAFASGTQTTSTLLTSTVNRISTVAASGDGVLLPFVKQGALMFVINGHATRAITVYGSGSDTVNGIAGATGYTLPAGRTALFVSPADTKWGVILSA